MSVEHDSKKSVLQLGSSKYSLKTLDKYLNDP